MQSNYRFIKNTLLPSLALGSSENIALILVDFVLIIYIYIYIYMTLSATWIHIYIYIYMTLSATWILSQIN